MFKVTPVTGITEFFTVTLHVAILAPSFVFTVIVALPDDTPVTFPVVSTVATFVLLLVHSTSLFVALLGLIVATKLSLAPVTKFSAVLFKVTPVTDITGFFTVTLHVATLDPSFVFTVIVALPADTPVTFPVVSTVATFVLLLVHSTSLFVALLGLIVATKLSLAPIVKFRAVLFKVIPETPTICPVFNFSNCLDLINNFFDAVGLIATYALLLLILKSSLLKFSSDTFNPSCTHLSPLIFLTIEQPFTLST